MKYFIIVLGIIFSSFLKAQVTSRVAVSKSDLVFSTNNNFNIISWNCTQDFIDRVAAPQLPVLIESFVVPLDAKINSIVISSEQKVELAGNYQVYPVQAPSFVGKIFDRFTEPDSLIYTSDSIFPTEKVKILSDRYEHGYHVVTVEVCPFEYIPKYHKVSLCNFVYSINYSIGEICYEYPLKRSSKGISRGTTFIRSFVKNTKDLIPFSNKRSQVLDTESCNLDIRKVSSSLNMLRNNEVEERIPEYIIVTNKLLSPVFQILANWKTKKGIPAMIKMTEDIDLNYEGADLAEKIRNYLKECRLKWGDDFFVLLGGDTNIIPPRMATNGPDRNDSYNGGTYPEIQ